MTVHVFVAPIVEPLIGVEQVPLPTLDALPQEIVP